VSFAYERWFLLAGAFDSEIGMYSLFPVDSMTAAFEMVCYCFTVAAALFSCLVTLRF